MTWTQILRRRRGLALFFDVISCGVALLLLSVLGGGATPPSALVGAACVVTTLASVSYCGLYRLPAMGNVGSAVTRLPVACVLTALGLAATQYCVDRAVLGAPAATTYGVMSCATLVTGRLFLSGIWRARPFRRRFLIVGGGPFRPRLQRRLQNASSVGIELVGVVGDGDEPILPDGECVGRVEELEKLVADNDVQHLIATFAAREAPFPADLLIAIKGSGVSIESGADVLAAMSERLPLSEMRPSELIYSPGFGTRRSYEFVRRGVDIAGALMGLVVAAPILAVAAMAIRLESPGSPIYQQRRVGVWGREFILYKLRSMRDDAEDETGATFVDEAGDARITSVGRFLRRTRIDELPQLWNVLRGDMSLVGPRPERPEFVGILQEHYPYFFLRHTVRPGLTGLAQVRLGYVSDLESWGPKLGHDVYYVKHRSLLVDLDILLATTRTVLLMRGA